MGAPRVDIKGESSMADRTAVIRRLDSSSSSSSSDESSSSSEEEYPRSKANAPTVKTGESRGVGTSTSSTGSTSTTTAQRLPNSNPEYSDVSIKSSGDESEESHESAIKTYQVNRHVASGQTTASGQSQAMTTVASRPAYTVKNLSPSRRKTFAEERRKELFDNQALIAAAKANAITKVTELIDAKVDINRPDAEGYTALHYAASHGHIHLAMALIENAANESATTKEGYTPIMLAAKKRRCDVVEVLATYSSLLQEQAKALQSTPAQARTIDHTRFHSAALEMDYKPETDRVELLRDAVRKNDVAMTARIIATGTVSLDEQDENGHTLLVLAAMAGNEEMIRMLLCAGAKVDTVDKVGKTPLMHAASTRHFSSLSTLLQAGALATHVDNFNESALSHAIGNDDADLVLALLDGKDTALRIDMANLLSIAATGGKTKSVKMLLAQRADLPDCNGSLSLAAMAKKGDCNAVRTLLLAGVDPRHKAYDGHTAFTLAAANDQLDSVKILIGHCPPRVRERDWAQRLQEETDSQGRTALMLAVLNRKSRMARYLLEHGADPHKTDCEGRNAILWAAAKGKPGMVTLLLGHRATHVSKDMHGNTVFLTAAETGNTKIVELFALPSYKNSMFDMNTPNKDGDTPLIVAARNGHLEIVKLLLDKGATLLHHNNQGRSARLESAANGHRDVLNLLEQKEAALPKVYPALDHVIKAIVKAVPAASHVMPRLQAPQTRQADKAGNSMIHLISSNGHRQLLSNMLGFPAKQLAGPGNTTATNSNDDGFELVGSSAQPLVSRQANTDIEILNREGLTPLCLAIRNGHFSTAQLLVEQGALVNHVSINDVTPLWLACRLTECTPGNATEQSVGALQATPEFMVDLMLRYGAAPDEPSFQGQTPLMAASSTGDTQIVKQLINAEANVNHVDAYGLTPLMYASHSGHSSVAKILLDAGAEPNSRAGRLGALMLAAEAGHDKLVRLLVEQGAQKNQVDEQGSTALIGASKAGNLSTVKLLMELGADMNAQNNAGHDALHYAKLKGHYAVVEVLQQGYPAPRDC
jgi:ankyrin repeat protein